MTDGVLRSARIATADTPAKAVAARSAARPEEAVAGAVWRVEIFARNEVERCPRWQVSFARHRKDRRYYELVEDTIDQGFVYRYFALTGPDGKVSAIQPFFINDQDILDGASDSLRKLAGAVRRVWPRFLRMRTLMIGCAVGEGHLDADDEQARFAAASGLAASILKHAKCLKAKLIVFKEFTMEDRAALACLKDLGFVRAPSMPMTKLELSFASFEDYMRNVLSANTRSRFRRDFKQTAGRAKLELRIVTDISPYVEEMHPLYLAVYERSALHFEKLTPEYLSQIGQRMPDKTVCFQILKDGKIVSFNLCLIQDKTLCSEYVGFDYNVAFDLHLYNVMTKHIIEWAISNGFEWFYSTSLNYQPKYQMRHKLYPLDLYVRHSSPIINFFLKRALPYLEPTHRDEFLPRFSNYGDVKG
jgi:hypothetical protein